MRIVRITHQYRRDFVADMVCEGCGATETWKNCYDDRYFHDEVIPNKPCKACGKSRNDLGIVGERTPTRYAEGEQV